MTHEFIEHTGEMELAIEAASEESVFAEALDALAELVRGEGRGKPVHHRVDVSAGDRGMLLVEFLTEILFLVEVDRFVPQRLLGVELVGDRLLATVVGRRGRPAHLVKAVTLNNLEVRPADGGWIGRVVFDV